jgi:hypothetical protein
LPPVLARWPAARGHDVAHVGDIGMQAVSDAEIWDHALASASSLIEAATLEADPSLQDMYANLMANALDPAYQGDVSPAFVSVIHDFSPFDALFLVKLYTFTKEKNWRACDLRRLEWRKHLGIDDDNDCSDSQKMENESRLYSVADKENFAVDNLSRLGCVRKSEPYHMPIPQMTGFGISLIDACASELVNQKEELTRV